MNGRAQKKYIKFLMLEAKTDPTVDSVKLAEIKKALKGGQCFSYAIQDAIFGVFHYDNWWQHKQYYVLTWNGKLNSLDKQIDLTPYLPTGSETNHSESLRQIINSSFNFTVTLQMRWVLRREGWIEYYPSQYNIFKPENHLEVLIGNKVYSVQDWDRVCGYFALSRLVKFLQDNRNIIAGNACLVYSRRHAINIKFRNDCWIIFDSNYWRFYRPNAVRCMTKQFRTDKGAAAEIFSVLGTHAIGFDVATFAKDQPIEFKFYDDLTPADAIDLMREDGLSIIIEHKKTYLRTLLNLAKQDETVKAAFLKALLTRHGNDTAFRSFITHKSGLFFEFMQAAMNDADYAKVVVDFFLLPEVDCPLKLIKNSAPRALPALMQIAIEYPELREKIAECLQAKKLFAQIILEEKDLFEKLVILSRQSQRMKNILLQQLPCFLRTTTMTRKTGLHKLAVAAPGSLVVLFQLALQEEGLQAALLDALVAKTKSGRSGFLYILRFAHESLPKLLKIAHYDAIWAQSLAVALLQENAKHRSGLESYLKKHPQLLPNLLAAARIQKEIYTALCTVLKSSSEHKKKCLIEQLIQASGIQPSRCLSHLKENKDDVRKFIDALIKAQKTAFGENSLFARKVGKKPSHPDKRNGKKFTI